MNDNTCIDVIFAIKLNNIIDGGERRDFIMQDNQYPINY